MDCFVANRGLSNVFDECEEAILEVGCHLCASADELIALDGR
jgi:hypothetical protein